MKTQHTQGEWKLDYSQAEIKTKKVYWITIRDNLERIIAEVKGSHYDIENSECEANAKLIASAPDLLEACILIRKCVAPEWLRETIELAIKKATE